MMSAEDQVTVYPLFIDIRLTGVINLQESQSRISDVLNVVS